MTVSCLPVTYWLAIRFPGARFISGAPLSECLHASPALSPNQQSPATQNAGESRRSFRGKCRSTPLKLIPNNALQVILPDTQPLALVIHIVVQVVSGHHTTHLMSEQLFNHMRWRTKF